MSEEKRPTIEEYMQDKDNKKDARSWFGFAQGEAVNFMLLHDLEKLTLEDGTGNKAVLKRLKDDSVKVDVTSTSIV